MTENRPEIDVWIVGDPAGDRVVRIPMVRMDASFDWRPPEAIVTNEWPSGRVTGRAVPVGSRDDKPLYRWTPASE